MMTEPRGTPLYPTGPRIHCKWCGKRIKTLLHHKHDGNNYHYRCLQELKADMEWLKKGD